MSSQCKSSDTASERIVTSQRRSTRISNRQAQIAAVNSTEKTRKRRRVSHNNSNLQPNIPDCNEPMNPRPECSVLLMPDFRKSSQISVSELVKREKLLLCKEKEYKLLEDELDKRLKLLSDRELEVTNKLSQSARQEAQLTLSQLEEHFTCALCYGIMAHPYALNPGQCGHTFCAICILKWFFSRLHRVCGGWHESVDCPICRSLLVITPDHTPRSMVTFPFVPNRVAAAVVESLIEKLAKYPLTIVVHETSETLQEVSVGGNESGSNCKIEDRINSGNTPADNDIDAWNEGGSLRQEWLKRDRDGKEEMGSLFNSWWNLKPDDFILLKQRLEKL